MAPIAGFCTRLTSMHATGRYLRARPHHATFGSAKYCIKCDGFCSLPSVSRCTNLQGGILTLFSISCQNLNGNLLHNPALQGSTVNE